MITELELLKLAKECKMKLPEEKLNTFLDQINNTILFIDTLDEDVCSDKFYQKDIVVNVFRKDLEQKSLKQNDFLDEEYFCYKVGE